VDQVVPVDVYVPGCPPGPETLIHGILTLHDLIRTGQILRRPVRAPASGSTSPSPVRPERRDPSFRHDRRQPS
jgi:NADH:ubiquinone oxidoreductase subunit B-like Fe-S oxidoreductase